MNGENEELKQHLQQMTAESKKRKQYLEQLKADNEKLIQRLTLMTNEASGQKKLAETPSADVFYQLFQYLNPDGTRSNTGLGPTMV